MSPRFQNHSFSMQLLVAFLVLIVLTTLSSSAPAYWLTRQQLEQQAWSNVHNAQQSTLSLLQAEQLRLANSAQLFAERPTLQQLLQEPPSPRLTDYLHDFQRQSDLDILLLCHNGRLLAGNNTFAFVCLEPSPSHFGQLDGQAALFASQLVLDQKTNQLLGVATLGHWLDNSFLEQLAANTGLEQSILQADGVRLASSVADMAGTVAQPELSRTTAVNQTQITLNRNDYFATYTQLTSTNSQTHLLLEVALPVNELLATERRALLILAGSTAVVALLAGLLGSWYVGQLVAPLHTLTETAVRISRGDLMAPIPQLPTPLEVSTLAQALQKSQGSMLQALAERSEARDRLDALIQSIVEGVVTLDNHGRVTFFSQGAETLTGWTAVEAVGKPINELFVLAEADEQRFLDQLPTSGKRQITIRTKLGKNIVLAVTWADLTAVDATDAEAVLVLRDVTQEETLQRLRSYFLANISHEFRTPLSTLNASIELLLDEKEQFSLTEVRQLLKPSHLSLLSLQTLVDNLLESSSIEAGQFSLRKRPFHINEAISNAVNIARPLLERRQQRLSLSEPPQLPQIEADVTRITQALINLITNASKYSPIGESIDILVELETAALRLTVADRGPGTPAAERMHLFHSFVRLHSTDGEQYGIGLGLYVVKTVIEAHGGTVGVDGREGGGSLFWFVLPYAATDN